MRTCPDCHKPVDEAARFCDNCGYSLSQAEAKPLSPASPVKPAPPSIYPSPAQGMSLHETAPGTCSACGFVNVVGEMFCQNCGVQLAPVASTPPPPPVPVSSAGPGPVRAVSAKPKVTPGQCPSCGRAYQPGEVYCQNCGMQLVEIKATPPATGDEENPTLPSLSNPLQGAPEASPERVTGRLIVKETGAEVFLPPGKALLLVGRLDPVRNVFPDIDLTPYGGESWGVSRIHARLVAQGANVFLEDLNSTNFTFLNRQKLQPGQRYMLKHKDEIRFGLLTVEFLAY